MADVLLIKPPKNIDSATHGSLPLSLAYLAGSLRACFSTEVADLQFFTYEHEGEEEPGWVEPLMHAIQASQPRPIFSCATSSSLLMLTAGPRG